MKFAFKTLTVFVLLSTSILASEKPILVTYSKDEQTAKWIQTVLSGPNINAPEALVEIRKLDEPCKLQDERMMQICVNDKGEFELVQIDKEDVKKAFAHLVSEQEVEDPKASASWEEIWKEDN